MWVTNELGVASFHRGPLRLEVDARGGSHGIHWKLSNSLREIAKEGVVTSTGEFQSVGDDVLPSAADQFMRGEEWHVSLPQESGSYWLDIVFRPLPDAHDDRSPSLVLEATLSIHTSLLDSHPTIDLCIPTEDLRRLDGSGATQTAQAAGCTAITLGQCAGVLLGPHDHPFTSDHCTQGQLRLRLFGEFLEKGVIRKARPWILLGSSDNEHAAELWEQLCGTPLPLNA